MLILFSEINNKSNFYLFSQDYSIRMKLNSGMPSTKTMRSSVDSNKEAKEKQYAKTGFVTLQVTVDSLLIALASRSMTGSSVCPFNGNQTLSVLPNIEV